MTSCHFAVNGKTVFFLFQKIEFLGSLWFKVIPFRKCDGYRFSKTMDIQFLGDGMGLCENCSPSG